MYLYIPASNIFLGLVKLWRPLALLASEPYWLVSPTG